MSATIHEHSIHFILRSLVTLLVGSVAGLLCTAALINTNNGGGDFGWALRSARDLIAGSDPYAYAIRPDLVSYPLPAAIIAIPLIPFNDEVAAGIFFGLSSGSLAWLILRSRQYWQLMIFLSWPFVYALLFAQWSPLILCLWYLPAALPLIVIKPHIALPLALTSHISRIGLILTLILVGISLSLYPAWPKVWLTQIGTYQGLRPPLLVFPLGPLVLLSLLRWRERRAWLLVSMALIPQRVVYDQMTLLLTAINRRQLIILVSCSWISLPVLWMSGGWRQIPGGWQLWIILTLYLPAVAVVVGKDLVKFLLRFCRRFQHSEIEGQTHDSP